MKFAEGDPALLIDSKGRHFLLRLDPGRTFQFHQGSVAHTELIGAEDGTWVTSSNGASLLLLSPRMPDFVLKMKRGAQVVYPKDVGPILIYGDIALGHTVLEAGTGSGALTLGLVRAVGPEGKVVTVDKREDHSAHAAKTLDRFFGGIPDTVEMLVGDVADLVESVKPDRMVLDLPEPWHAIKAAADHMPSGGVATAYLPTVPQVQKIVSEAEETGRFSEIEVKEFMHREWNVSGRSVRPEHQMVGHTGFLVFMRKTAPKPDGSNPKK